MKKYCSFILILFAATVLQAQIPNASFETWSNGLPSGWYGLNTNDTLFVQSTDYYAGSYALRMNVTLSGDSTTGGYIYTGDTLNSNFPVDSIPLALYGWYISHPADSGDGLIINSALTVDGLLDGEIGAYITDTTAVYKQFEFNYNVSFLCECYDSVSIEFSVQNQTGHNLSLATYFIIDDLSFGPAIYPAGITNVSEEPVLEQCYPNPATGKTNIVYSIADNGTVSLVLYDVTGRLIKTLLQGVKQGPGRYKVPTDVSELPGGVYFYCLDVNGQTLTQKLVVAR